MISIKGKNYIIRLLIYLNQIYCFSMIKKIPIINFNKINNYNFILSSNFKTYFSAILFYIIILKKSTKKDYKDYLKSNKTFCNLTFRNPLIVNKIYFSSTIIIKQLLLSLFIIRQYLVLNKFKNYFLLNWLKIGLLIKVKTSLPIKTEINKKMSKKGQIFIQNSKFNNKYSINILLNLIPDYIQTSYFKFLLTCNFINILFEIISLSPLLLRHNYLQLKSIKVIIKNISKKFSAYHLFKFFVQLYNVNYFYYPRRFISGNRYCIISFISKKTHSSIYNKDLLSTLFRGIKIYNLKNYKDN